MLQRSLRAMVLLMLASGLQPVCRAEHLWIVPEPVGFDGRVHVYPCQGRHPDQIPHVFRIQLWRISDVKTCKSVELASEKESLISIDVANDPGAIYVLSHDCGVNSAGGEPNRTLLHAKSYTSADPSTWRPLRVKRLPLEIVPTRDRERFTFAVTFNGNPVANPMISVCGPDGFKCDVKGDAEGRVTCGLPQSGMYGLCTTLVDSQPGTIEGRRFSGTRHYSTLTVPVEVIPARK